MPTQNNWEYSGLLELSPDEFVTPPTSIRNKEGAGGHAVFMPDGTHFPIPNGQFTFWSYFTAPGLVELAFRIQHPPSYPLSNAYYYLQYSSYGPTAVYRYEAPTSHLLGLIDYVPTPDAWDHLQLFWSYSCALDGTPSFETVLAKETPWGFIAQGIAWDSRNKWPDSPTNDFAFILRTDELAKHCYLDDSRLELHHPNIIYQPT